VVVFILKKFETLTAPHIFDRSYRTALGAAAELDPVGLTDHQNIGLALQWSDVFNYRSPGLISSG